MGLTFARDTARAMSRGNVELAHRAYEAFNRRDWDTFLALMDEDLVDPFWQPIRWGDGKCVWWRNCSTQAEALEAIGDPE